MSRKRKSKPQNHAHGATATHRGLTLVLDAPNDDLVDETLDATGVGLVWHAATNLLCEYFDNCAEMLISAGGARAVELGSGAGVAGMVWARLCASRGAAPAVTLTDYHPTVLKIIAQNVDLNGLSGSCTVERLAWGDAAPRARAQLVFGSELAVSESSSAALAATLDALLTPRGLFLYAHTARRAIFRGAGGELCREDGDSALQTLVAALAPRRCVELAADDSGDERVVLLAFGSTAADLASMQRRG